MSKKANKAQPEKKQIEIVDQQKDPMLRVLQKKVRNINKKLNEIAQLSVKKDLKPEQEEKINRKNQVIQEKEKILEMIETYKEIAVESEKIIRKTQLAELEDLAHILAAKEYSVDLGAALNQNVDNLVRLLTTSTNDLSLKERVNEISSALLQAANNLKLKKNVREFVEANPDKRREAVGTPSIEPEPLSSQSEKDREAELKDFETEEKRQKVQNVVDQTNEPAPEPTPQPAVVEPQVTQSVVEPQKVQVVEDKPAPVVTESQNPPAEATQKAEEQKEGAKQERRGYRGYRGREKPRGERNGEKLNEEGKPYKKRNFKPKYENEQNQKRSTSSSSQSSDSEPKARQFKREEVRELIEDGFIVVGKPKIKARDQKEYHDHQHGKKHHHHQNKKNY